MSKKGTTKVRTVSLPGDRGPEIQYHLTAFKQSSKKKRLPRLNKIVSTQIAAKNVTTNIVHTSTPAEDSNIKDVPNDNHTENKKTEPTVIVPLKDTTEPKIKNLDEYTTKLSTEFCCANDNDTTGSWIAGIEFVQDGHIIILDTNNCKLKRFNALYKFQSEIEVPVDCANLTKISDKEVAVTCLNEIHFYSIGHFGMSRSSKHFEVNGDVFGISYEGGMYAITCDIEDEDRCAIRILDIFGDEIHTIRAKDCVEGNINIGPYCAIDSVSKVVAVSDFDNRYVLGFQYNGSLRWKCEVEGGPRGLMKMGNEFLVSDNYGQEICAISVDSGKKRTLLQDDDGVFNPEFIACNHRNFRLIITQRAFDTVSVFNLTKSC